jgi:uncharacterized protein YciI
MPVFAVIVERGREWDWSLPMRKQTDWDAHAAFMDKLANERVILAGGPLGGEDEARTILHVFDVPDKHAIMKLLDEDPWHRSGLLRIASIDPWNLLLGSIK